MLLINSLQTNYYSRSYLFSYESITSGFYVDSFWQLFYFLLLFLNFSASKVQWRSACKGWQLVMISVAWNCISCSTWGRKKAGELHSLLSAHPEIDRNIPYWSGGSCNNHHKVSHAHFCTSKTLTRVLETMLTSDKEESRNVNTCHVCYHSPTPCSWQTTIMDHISTSVSEKFSAQSST